MTIDPEAKTVQAAFRETENGETGEVGTFPSRPIPARWIDGGEPLAVGIISSRGNAPRFAATWGGSEVFEGGSP